MIRSLSRNEDELQDLWLFHLEGNQSDSFCQHIEQARKNKLEKDFIEQGMQRVLAHPPSAKMLEFLDKFSELERSVMFLVMIGLTIDQISNYKSISHVRLQQILSTIRNSKEWNDYGI